MCGIAGYIGKKQLSPRKIGSTLKLMENRGPDNQAYLAVQRGEVNIDFLHARLSIIDLGEQANQPFKLGPYTLIFNGEIYNYVEIRKELKRLGAVFLTNSDTEVLLQSYIKWGDKCVDHFEGMWSFAIYDGKRRRLLLSRDRFAEKPLYYLLTGDGLYFASEIKFLWSMTGRLGEVNQKHVLRYLVNGYKSLYKTEETYFKGVREVPYATNMVVDNDLKISKRRYWKPLYQPEKMSLDEAVGRTREALLESMRLRLRSDVPLAFCLSGGVDSSSLTSIAAKQFGHEVAAFSIIDSDERYNEYDNIMATVRDIDCKHTVVKLKPGGMLEQLQKLVAYHDAPVATITYLVHSFLIRFMAQQGYKVTFSGTAADELFTGYFDHWMWHLAEMKGNGNKLKEWQKHIKPLVRNPLLQDPQRFMDDTTLRDHIYLDCDEFASYLRVDWQEEFEEEKYTESVLRNRMMNELFHEGTRLILHEDDLNSMMYSIENRSPYLDKNLFEVAYSIPVEHLMKDGYSKYPLRAAMKGILNDKVRLDRHKKGFNASIHSIVDMRNDKDREYILADGPIYDLVDKSKIEQLMKRDYMSNSFSKFFFNFLSAKIFLEVQSGLLKQEELFKKRSKVSV